MDGINMVKDSPLQVRLWDVEAGTCLLTFTEPENFVRCVAFQGQVCLLFCLFCMCFLRLAKHFITQRIVSGDFGGEVHLWDLRSKDGKFEVANHRKWECHKVYTRFCQSFNYGNTIQKILKPCLKCCFQSLIQNLILTSGSYCLHTAFCIQNRHWIKVV